MLAGVRADVPLNERTLTDDEAAKVRSRIVKRLQDAIGAELRA